MHNEGGDDDTRQSWLILEGAAEVRRRISLALPRTLNPAWGHIPAAAPRLSHRLADPQPGQLIRGRPGCHCLRLIPPPPPRQAL